MPEIEAAIDTPAPKLRLCQRRKRWVSVALGLALLLCGMVIGGSLTFWYLFDRVMMTIHEPERVPHLIVKRMRIGLDLTDEQVAKIEPMYMDLQRELVDIRDKAMPGVERALQATREKVSAELTPEQSKEYNRVFDKLQRAFLPHHEADE